MDTDVAYRSALELANDIAGRRVSPVEVMEATLRLVEVRQPSLNAIVFRGFDDTVSVMAPASAAGAGCRP